MAVSKTANDYLEPTVLVDLFLLTDILLDSLQFKTHCRYRITTRPEMLRSKYAMNTVMPMYRWDTIPWQHVQRSVFKLQKRIYQASRRGDVRTVRKLQRLLMKSRSAKLHAVRRVTQDNQGKRTAGIDGVKSLTPPQRLALAGTLTLEGKAIPVRRSWISKPGSTEQRPLGIPTLPDRAHDALVNLQLLHRHCHDRKTARETGSRGADDKRRVVEEPDEGKPSRPVLKPSQEGRPSWLR